MTDSSDSVGGTNSADSADGDRQPDRSISDAERVTKEAMRGAEAEMPAAAGEPDHELAAGAAAREALEAQDRAAMERTRAAAREALGLAGETPPVADPATEAEVAPETATPDTYADSYASQVMSGINEGIASALGGPVDLVETGLNGLSSVAEWAGVPDAYTPEFSGSFLGSDHIESLMTGIGSVAPESADPTKQAVRNAAEILTEIGSAFVGVGTVRISGYSAQADEAIEAAADLNPESVDLALSYMRKWSDVERAAADGKVQALTDADTVVSVVVRSGTAAGRKYAREVGPIPPGHDIDHVIDLQLGGADDILNMSPLHSSVNRSLGAQIQHRIKDLPVGTPVNRVTIGD